MSITYAVIGLVTIALGLYLAWALFRPEDFE